MERGKLVADRYELIGRLGRGSMGEVWAARDRVLRRDVALKLLVPEGTAQADLRRRFEREAVAAAQIVHPNVAALYDRGIHDDAVFLVMEKVDGRTLTACLQAESPFPLTRAVAVADGICAALEAAHRAQVIHYDIKPHNVILTGDGRVKVIDFGIAGFVQAAFTVARSTQLTPAGTPEYGAPEQFLTERGDERSDLYALGGRSSRCSPAGRPSPGTTASRSCGASSTRRPRPSTPSAPACRRNSPRSSPHCCSATPTGAPSRRNRSNSGFRHSWPRARQRRLPPRRCLRPRAPA
ncbi:serine/threonine protein kinase [Streptomyces sp. L06]|nr:serine/threonine protein kinase [Streptomyces sp. L06]